MVLTYEHAQKLSAETVAEQVAYLLFSRAGGEGRFERHQLMPDSRELEEEHFMTDSREISRPLDIPGGTFLSIKPEPESGQVGIAGFDLRFGRFVIETDTIMENGAQIQLKDFPHKFLEPGEEYILHADPDGNKVYYVASFEEVSLSPDLEILIDSKSTTGRVGCMSHFSGWAGGRNKEGKFSNTKHLLSIIQPFSFPLKVTCGKTRLAQAVVKFKDTPYMTNEQILKSGEVGFSGDGFSLEDSLTPKGLQMRFSTHLAYRAKKCDKPIDMDSKTSDWRDYFELVEGNDSLTLDRKTLYLLGSLGVIDLKAACGLLSREQEVITGTGAWGHFAGIFQPFWRGGVTMEFYSHSKRKISRGDRAGVVIFDEVQGIKERPKDYGGSYQNQVPPLLPKMFAQ